MRAHSPTLGRSFTVMLAYQMKVIWSVQQQSLLGMSEEGTRYYFELCPKGMAANVESVARQTVDGFNCHHVRPYLEPHESSKDCLIWIYTMDDSMGYKQYWAPGKIGRKTCFETLTPVANGKQGTRPLQPDHPVVSTANRLCTENQLLLTENEEKPVPNGVYYGFTEGGLEATLRFNGESRLEHVEVGGPQKRRYNELIYNMFGKAINCVFGREGESKVLDLILEPVDPTKFDGSKESFSRARMNTLGGRPFDSKSLPSLLGLSKSSKLEAVTSRAVRRFRAIRNSASVFRRDRRDAMAKKLLGGSPSDTEDEESLDGPERVTTE
ncbi:hypothetical protein FOZ63_025988 [Perkinsus olseni]|uniref:Uncharacterized protein n=1 Tax=Perkinsus olseni TaxID=32597 RepID=A0A7J6S0C6_PEROL|nr:hypothetical protein FOZ60_014940 [Perkinsus olseni]KAF4717790.1 hypothetical protein FOZ62_024293 [Perkinsus olseni]KAF4726005.1 hypothetical protein FOZ63_025988 [Perkinsus olseni]